jgi:ubiquinone/menaquinone biosynthesis C-methylase UbiE
MPSLSFDRVAHAYDATRGYPNEVARQIARAIAAAVDATAQTRFLEMGIGTGRIAFPLAALGHIYTGVDIAEKMVEQLEAKLVSNGWQEREQPWGALPDEDSANVSLVRRFVQAEKPASARLVIADMTRLPFYAASFDVALAVHVLHLVDGWQKALGEALRVLRPGGYFLHCWDEHVIDGDERHVKRAWENIVRQLGGEVKRPGASSARADVTPWLRERGLQPQELRVVSWETKYTPRQALESVTKRLWSGTWVVPDDLFAASIERLGQWAKDQFGSDLDTERVQKNQFVISRTQVH